jgi:hypothetical protein
VLFPVGKLGGVDQSIRLGLGLWGLELPICSSNAVVPACVARDY